jgi:uncharacterized protein YjdB
MKKTKHLLLLGLFMTCLALVSRSQTYNWKTVRIGGGGFVTSINAHPKVQHLRFITTDVGNPYRWNNTTQAWEGLMNNFSAIYWGAACSNLTFDPQDSTGNILYATIGKGATVGSNAGTIMKSTDRGTTWTDLGLPVWVSPNSSEKGNGERIVVDPLNSNVVYVTTRRPANASEVTTGLYRSTNAGSSWIKVDTIYGTFIAFDTSGGLVAGVTRNIYIGSAKGVYRSTDGGGTFALLSGSPLNVRKGVLRGNGILYTTSAAGVYKYNGAAWTTITPASGTGNYTGVEVNPGNSSQVMVATDNYTGTMYITGTGGSGAGAWTKLTTTRDNSEIPWSPGNGNAGNTLSDFAWDPFNAGEVWFSDLLNAYQTTNVWASPCNWKVRAVGHEEVVVTGPLIAPPSGTNILYSTVADVAGFNHASLVSPPTKEISGDFQYANSSGVETTGAAFSEANPGFTVRVGSKGWNGAGLGGYSIDGGQHYTPWVCPVGMSAGRIAVSATSETMIWTTQSGWTYRSTDRGNSWTKINSVGFAVMGNYDGSLGIFNVPADMNPLAADKVNGDKFYIYLSGKMLVSTDGGLTFTQGATNLPSYTSGTGNIAYAKVETTPGKEGDIWVGVEGNGLYHSTNSGQTFTKISNVQSAKLMAVGKAAINTPAVYVFGTVNNIPNSIFRSDDNGVTWTTVASPAICQLLNMTADRRVYGRIIAGSAGSGIFYGEPVPASVTGVTLVRTRDTLAVGVHDTLTAYVLPAWAANKKVSWSSSDTLKLKVNDSTGVITGVGTGTAVITVTTQDGSHTAKDTVLVTAAIPVTALAVSPSPAAVAVSDSLLLSVTITPASATNRTILWISSDTSIAKVNAAGMVRGTGAGTAVITAAAQGTSIVARDTVHVSVVAATAVSIDSGTSTVSVPDTIRLKVRFTPANTSNKKVTWTSSNASIATVDSNGLVKAIAAGTVTITATSVSGGLTATRTVTVAAEAACGLLMNSGFESGLDKWYIVGSVINGNPAASVTTVSANVHSGTKAIMVTTEGGVSTSGTMLVNGAQQLTFSGWSKIEDGPVYAGFGIDYVDSAGNKIDQSAFTVTATAWQQYSITRVTPANTARVSVWTYKTGSVGRMYLDDFCVTATNVVHVTGVSITPSPATTAVGYTRALTANIVPANASTKTVTWTSTNPAIATVNAAGVVTGVALGTDTIKAVTTDGGLIASTVLSVTPFVAVTGVDVDPDSVTIGVQDKYTLTATVSPSTASVTTVAWSSSNTGIATVNAAGVVTAVAAGNATITATTTSGGMTSASYITVVPMGQCGLLSNNGFESGFVNWSNNGNASAITTVPSEVHSGLKAIKTTGEGGIGVYIGTLPVPVGSILEFSTWAKVSGSPYFAGFSMDFLDHNNVKLATSQITVTAGSYTHYDTVKTIPAGTEHINIWTAKSGPGALIMDDFCLTVVSTGGSALSGNLLKGMTNTLSTDLSTDVSVTEYPNPVQGEPINLRLHNYAGTQVLAILSDMTGREMLREVIHTAPGVESYSLNMRTRPASGQYILTVVGTNVRKSFKVFIK